MSQSESNYTYHSTAIKKTGPKVKVEDYEITFNRLMGLTAAYVFENRWKFPNIRSSQPEATGFGMGTKSSRQMQALLICLIKMGNIKNAEGITMAKVMKSSMISVKIVWMMFPGAAIHDLQTLMVDTPEFKGLFKD
ncbi:hypothetical protein HW555_003685 [Spodoptera exigua]|uniref:Uncharacterized protein n=1 Tax=Spodoptera exigua TaxID=7107 RepID=A0A835GNC2_SPOEX|nr:hypothetical protein HW555_003685 [Spodoptera exigua]